MSPVSRLALLPLALLIAGLSPAPSYIPLGRYDEGLVIPANTPVTFRHFNEHYDSAKFSGRFVLEGIFILDCDYCEPGYKDNEIRLSIVPDPAIAGSLPHWKKHDEDIAIVITNPGSFVRAMNMSTQRRLLLAGKLDEVRGRAAIVVDQYEASLECDSASYSARFLAIAKPPKIAKLEVKGDFGCGMI